MRHLWLALLIWQLDQSPRRQADRLQTSSSDSLVYEAVLDSAFPGRRPTPLVITDSTLRFDVPGPGVPEWHAKLASFPANIVTRLAERARQSYSTANLPLVRARVTITSAELVEIFRDGPGEGWWRFMGKFPESRGYVELSPIAWGEGGVDALVYYQQHCGPLCGQGALLWVVRDAGGRWRVRQKLRFWVS